MKATRKCKSEIFCTKNSEIVNKLERKQLKTKGKMWLFIMRWVWRSTHREGVYHCLHWTLKNQLWDQKLYPESVKSFQDRTFKMKRNAQFVARFFFADINRDPQGLVCISRSQIDDRFPLSRQMVEIFSHKLVQRTRLGIMWHGFHQNYKGLSVLAHHLNTDKVDRFESYE